MVKWLAFALMAILVVAGCSSSGASATGKGSDPSGKSASSKPAGSSRDNPVPYGDGYEFKKSGRVYTVTVTDALTNAKAAVKAANMFNSDPPDGNDYIVPKLRIEYSEGQKDKAYKTSDGGYKFYADNRFWGAPSTSVAQEPKFDGQDIFPGATVEGWLGGRYMPAELIDDAVLVYDDVYFSLK